MNLADQRSESTDWDQLATCYEESVISPFAQGVRFRLAGDIRRILNTWRSDGTIGSRIVMDFGCGCGPALSLIAQHVGFVIGIDFSEAMLDESQKRLKEAGIDVIRYSRRKGIRGLAREIDVFEESDSGRRQTILVNRDLRRLGPLHKRADLGLAINSICPPNARDVRGIFREVTACIKPGGLFIFVFPSLDTMYHLFKLVRRYRVKKTPDLGIVEDDGVYVEPNGDRQKFFTPDEIHSLFDSEGWAIDEIEKIRYPWDLTERMGWGYFPGHHRLWDWYVIGHARKR